jgi:hypothetical protein
LSEGKDVLFFNDGTKELLESKTKFGFEINMSEHNIILINNLNNCQKENETS